jgi:uncharacterized membrane protein YGL010W
VMPIRPSMREVDDSLSCYGDNHRHPVNKAVHWLCVPLIIWSLLGMLWAASPGPRSGMPCARC